ncbi:MAG: hypothetical protein QM671_19730 [Bacillus sp. (in: firmicutes)]
MLSQEGVQDLLAMLQKWVYKYILHIK